jgi:hypothetical protein
MCSRELRHKHAIQELSLKCGFMVPVNSVIKENLQEIYVIHFNIRGRMVVESGGRVGFKSNPLTLHELRLQIFFEAAVQTLTEVRLVLLTAMKKTWH